MNLFEWLFFLVLINARDFRHFSYCLFPVLAVTRKQLSLEKKSNSTEDSSEKA